MEDVLIKFGGGCSLDSCGYTGNNDRVSAALNQIFAPEISVAGISLPSLFGQEANSFGSQSVGNAAAIGAGIGGR